MNLSTFTETRASISDTCTNFPIASALCHTHNFGKQVFVIENSSCAVCFAFYIVKYFTKIMCRSHYIITSISGCALFMLLLWLLFYACGIA
jgi:hypothetical protein